MLCRSFERLSLNLPGSFSFFICSLESLHVCNRRRSIFFSPYTTIILAYLALPNTTQKNLTTSIPGQIRALVLCCTTHKNYSQVYYCRRDQPTRQQSLWLWIMVYISKSYLVLPGRFVNACRPPWFEKGSQQDCSEFFRFVDFDAALGAKSTVGQTK